MIVGDSIRKGISTSSMVAKWILEIEAVIDGPNATSFPFEGTDKRFTLEGVLTNVEIGRGRLDNGTHAAGDAYK